MYLRYLVDKRDFHRDHGYTVALPDHPAFRALYETPHGPLRWDEFESTFRKDLYRAKHYARGVARLNAERALLAQTLPYLRMLSKAWPFEIRDHYTVIVTLYGVGGSYDVPSGRILVRTDRDGTFRRAQPFHTVLHEMVHIGIEEPLVRPLRLRHPEKERVVDLLCSFAIPSGPTYVQNERGDRRVDPYVTPTSVRDLPASLRRYRADQASALAA